MAFFFVVILATIFHVNAQGEICDDTWTIDGGKCYKMVMDRANKDDALASCGMMGSTLATVLTEEKNEFIKAKILESGTRYSVLTGGVLSADLGTLTWTEGVEDSGYSHWAINFPKNRGRDTCLAINKWGRWKNKNCEKRQPYFCQKTLTCDVEHCVGCINDNYCAQCEDGYADIARNGTCVDYNLACDDGWSMHRDFCYKVMTYDEDFYTAMDTCADEEGSQTSLAVITSAAANLFISNLLRADLPESGHAWVGHTVDTNDNVYRIDTGAETDYSNWATRFPDARGAENECVSINDVNPQGRWKNQRCVKYLPFVCRKLWNFGANYTPFD